MNQVIEQLRQQAGVTSTSTAGMHEALRERVREIAGQCFFGFDINPDLVKATKMNMVMNNDGAGNILRQDSLLHPHQWDSEFKENLAKAVGINPNTIRQPEDLALFDVIATNPPFGSKLPIKDRETPGSALHVMLFFENLIRALLIFNGLRGRYCQRALLVYHYQEWT